MNFLDTYKEYLKLTENVNNHKINLSKLKFIDPMLILLISDYIKNDRYIPPTDPNVQKYVKIMTKSHPENEYDPKSFLPITSIKDNDDTIEKFCTGVQKKFNIHNPNALNYIFGELTDNILQHSQAKNNYILSQFYKDDGLEICIYDDGIGIKKSYENARKNIDNTGIEMALNGLSTKEDNERGEGISSVYRIVEANPKNQFIIISNDELYHYLNGKSQIYPLQNKYKLNGTYFGILFKNKKDIDNINIYDYC